MRHQTVLTDRARCVIEAGATCAPVARRCSACASEDQVITGSAVSHGAAGGRPGTSGSERCAVHAYGVTVRTCEPADPASKGGRCWSTPTVSVAASRSSSSESTTPCPRPAPVFCGLICAAPDVDHARGPRADSRNGGPESSSGSCPDSVAPSQPSTRRHDARHAIGSACDIPRRSMVDTACEPFAALPSGVPDAVVEQQERNDVVDMW
jgi:hypothetical protein